MGYVTRPNAVLPWSLKMRKCVKNYSLFFTHVKLSPFFKVWFAGSGKKSNFMFHNCRLTGTCMFDNMSLIRSSPWIVISCAFLRVNLKFEIREVIGKVMYLNYRLYPIQTFRFCTFNLLSSVLGSWSVMTMSPIVGRLAPIITRHCLTSIAASPDWDTKFEMGHFLPCRGQILVGKYHYSRH